MIWLLVYQFYQRFNFKNKITLLLYPIKSEKAVALRH